MKPDQVAPRARDNCALAAFVLVIASVIPQNSFAIDGREVSYSVWWTRGAGPVAVLLGVLFPICGYLFLLRKPNARAVYLASLTLSLIVSYVMLQRPLFVVLGGGLVAFGARYLYCKPTVAAYFASNQRLERP